MEVNIICRSPPSLAEVGKLRRYGFKKINIFGHKNKESLNGEDLAYLSDINGFYTTDE